MDPFTIAEHKGYAITTAREFTPIQNRWVPYEKSVIAVVLKGRLTIALSGD